LLTDPDKLRGAHAVVQPRRVTLPNGATGTAYESDGRSRRWVKLDSGNSAWLTEADLTLVEGEPDWRPHQDEQPCRRCGGPGAHLYPGGRWCETCVPLTNPTPDPALTAVALRKAAGLPDCSIPLGRTRLDERHQRQGKSSPGWRRRAHHGLDPVVPAALDVGPAPVPALHTTGQLRRCQTCTLPEDIVDIDQAGYCSECAP
jgi:hypothetical protein